MCYTAITSQEWYTIGAVRFGLGLLTMDYTHSHDGYSAFDKCLITTLTICHDSRNEHYTSVASFIKEVNPRSIKRPLIFNGRSANRESASFVKEATGLSDCRLGLQFYETTHWINVNSVKLITSTDSLQNKIFQQGIKSTFLHDF